MEGMEWNGMEEGRDNGMEWKNGTKQMIFWYNNSMRPFMVIMVITTNTLIHRFVCLPLTVISHETT